MWRVKKNKANKERQIAATSPKGLNVPWMSYVTHIRKADWALWTLALAVVVSFVLVSRPHWTEADIPFGDGRWYTQQAIELHGLLFSGQWSKFWTLFCDLTTATLIPTYLLFILVPTVGATGPVYGIINCLAWHLIMACSIYGILRLAGRVNLAAPVFLMTVANNFVLDGSYYYYLDMSFAAMCLLSLFLLFRAFMSPVGVNFLWAGMGAGLIFFVKPGGAFVFIGLYGLAMGLWMLAPLMDKPRPLVGQLVSTSARRAAIWLAAFLPITLTAMFWNAAQRIIQQWVETQQGTYFSEALNEGGLLRLFYFPLCLSYFYSFAVLAVLVVVAAFWFLQGARSSKTPEPLTDGAHRAMGILAVVFVVIWGLVFSFVMTFKPIRSLPLMIPVLWLVLFTLTGLRRLPARRLLILAVAYFAVAHVQFAWGPAIKSNRLAETYHVSGDWMNRLPAKAPDAEAGLGITRMLQSSLAKMGVTTGVVAVGTEMLYWNSCSLNWISQLDDLRMGHVPQITFKTAADNKGNPIEIALKSMSAMVLLVHPQIQYSKGVYDFNVKMANLAMQQWQPKGLAKAQVLSMGDGKPAVVLVAFNKPLSDAELNQIMTGSFPGGYSAFSALDDVFGRRLGWRDLWRLMRGEHAVFTKDRTAQ